MNGLMWQDYVFTIGQFIFIAALFPSVFSQNKPAKSTSLLTGLTLLVFAATYTSLHLWFAGATTTLAAAVWLILAAQVLLTRK